MSIENILHNSLSLTITIVILTVVFLPHTLSPLSPSLSFFPSHPLSLGERERNNNTHTCTGILSSMCPSLFTHQFLSHYFISLLPNSIPLSYHLSVTPISLSHFLLNSLNPQPLLCRPLYLYLSLSLSIYIYIYIYAFSLFRSFFDFVSFLRTSTKKSLFQSNSHLAQGNFSQIFAYLQNLFKV